MVVEVYNDLCDIYETDRQRPRTEDWPPNQPAAIVNLALIHYQNMRTQQEVIEFSKRCSKEGASCVDKLDSHPNVTKDIKELFKSDGATETRPPKRILIEGAPGIGKTILTKEIAYQWANDEILKEYKLVFLLYLRDPKVHEVQSVKDILELFAFENTPELNAYIKKRRGKNVAFLLDGFDEYPVALQRKSFITDLIKCENDGKLFLNSAVIVTSRPTATLFLHNIVDRRIEILGFPKEERDKYVSMSLKDSPNKTQKLDEYLKKHPIINSVCYVPLHLAILMYLFKQGSLPETLTEMNESFIIYTIYHYLKKKGLSSHDDVVNKLTDLPENVIKFVYKLANLAFSGLENNQLVFSLDEIKKNCREVDDINGLGLLQAVQHYPKKGAGGITSVNFLHFTMQEYLAALHVSTHPSWLQSSLMERTFWDGKFNFMWMMYVGIVGVKSEGFASFIASNEWHIMSDDIPDDYQIKVNICNDKLKCLHLFQCYIEAKSDAEMPEEISSIFTSNEITLSGMTLLPHHISSLIFFMSTSSMQWQILNLGNCNLGDVGVNSLLEHVIKNDQNLLSLEYVDLSGNNSSPWGVYCAIIRHCCVNSLTLCGDEGMKEYTKEITDSLQTNAALQSLTLCKIGRTGVESIERILANSTNAALKELNLSWECNGKGTKIFSRKFKPVLQNNDREININILCNIKSPCSLLWTRRDVSLCDELPDVQLPHVHVISFGLCVKVKELKLSLDMNGSACVEHVIPLKQVWKRSSPWGVYCDIIRHCCVNSLTLYGDEGMEGYVKEITDCLQAKTTLQSLTLCKIGRTGVESIERILANSTNAALKELNLSWECNGKGTKIFNRKFKPVLQNNDREININILCNIKSPCSLLWIRSDISLYDELPDVQLPDYHVISFGLCVKVKELKLSLDMNGSACVEHAIPLKQGWKRSSPWGVYCAIIRHCCVNSLSLCGDEAMKEYTKEITDSLQTNAVLQSLTLWKIGRTGVESIERILANAANTTLKELNLSWGNNAKGTKILSTHFELIPRNNDRGINVNILCDDECEYLPETISLSNTVINNDVVYLLSLGLYNNTTIKKLDFPHRNISINGMSRLSECIKHPISLEYVDLSGNYSSPWGVYCAIIKHCCVNSLTLCGDEGMKEYTKEIIDSLQTNAVLQSLTLWKIGRTGVESIERILANAANTTLKELNLSWGNNAKGTKILSTHFELIPRNNDRGINVNILCDDECEYLPETISLSNTVINNDVVYLLSLGLYNNTTIKKLDFPHRNISINGMSRLSECIKHPISLEYVDLSGNETSPWGVYCAVIKHCRVNSLTLYGNEGIEKYVEEITHSLHINRTLQSLTLCAGNLRMYKEMVVKASNTKWPFGILAVDGKQYCKTLDNGDRKVTSNSNDRVVNIKVLYATDCCLPETISLSNTVINDDVVYLLSLGLYNNTTIKKLDFPHRNISINGMSRLSECIKHPISLEYVDLSGNEASPWGVYCAIIKHCCVNSLTLCGDEGMKEYTKEIADCLQTNSTLQSLTLCEVRRTGVESIESILATNPNKALQELNLSWRSNANGTKILTTNLKPLPHSNEGMINVNILCDDSCEYLPETITLSWEDINDDVMYLLSLGLYNNTTVKKLDLPYGTIGTDGMSRLSKCIKHSMPLEYVDLSRNVSSPWGLYCVIIRHCCVNNLSLCGDEGMEEYVKEITKSLLANTTLQSLTLCKIGRIGVKLIESILANGVNTTLKELNLSWGSDAKGTKMLSTNFKSIPHSNESVINVNILCDGSCEYLPETITLSDSDVNKDAMYLLSLGLYNNTTVKKLDLPHRAIGTDEMIRLSECITYSIPLEYVDLSGSWLSPWGVYCAIIEHCCVNSLTLCGDEGMKEYVKEITECLQTNATLQSLTLCKIGRTGVESIERILANSTNTALKELNLSWGSIAKGTKILSTNLQPLPHSNESVINVNILCDGSCEYLPETITLSWKDINDDVMYLLSLGLYNNTIVKKLDLPYGIIGIDGMNRLSKCIEHSMPLEYVDLSENNSSPWGLYCAIIRHCCVNSLTLCGDEGMEECVKEISDSLQTNTTLQSLTLCKIGRIGVKSVESILANGANTTLKELNLSWGSNAKGTKMLNTNFKSIPHGNESVINVNILCDGSCEYLPETITLSCSDVSDDVIYLLSLGLCNNTTVKKLDLSYKTIGTDGMIRLSECITYPIPLEYVDLSGNWSSPWGVYCAIIRHCCVNSLTLCGDEGMKEYVMEIMNSLQINITLQSLTLFTSRRCKDMITVTSNQNILVIDGKLLFDAMVDSSRNVALNCNNRVVNIKIVYDDGNSNITFNDDCMHEGDCGHLSETDSSRFDLPLCNKLDLCDDHKSLSLPDSQISELLNATYNGVCMYVGDYDRLSETSSLLGSCDDPVLKPDNMSLSQERTYVYSSDVNHLSYSESDRFELHSAHKQETVCNNDYRYTRIHKTIDLSHENIAIGPSQENIVNDDSECLPGHEYINLSHETIAIGSSQENLVSGDSECFPEYIDLSFKDINDNKLCLISFGLCNNTTVKKINLSHSQISNYGMKRLSECVKYTSSLEYIDLSGNKSSPWDVYCTIIEHCCVDNLTLCGDEGMKKYTRELKHSLQRNTTLQSLTLCKVGRIGLLSIKHALDDNTTLKELNLSWKSKGTKIIHRKVTPNEFSNTNLGTNSHEGMIDVNVLYDGDHECSSEVINMSNGDINDDAVCLITFGLYNNTTVRMLDLSCNNITDDGAVVISDCFKNNYSLHTLILSKNRISYKGAMNIAEMIKVNKGIQKLDMSCNNICDDGAVAVSESLKTNNVLQELDLSSNQITSKGAKKIAEALWANEGLHKLDISDNSICDDGIIHISNSLKENNTLQELNLSKSGVSLEGAKIIAEALYTLKKFSIST